MCVNRFLFRLREISKKILINISYLVEFLTRPPIEPIIWIDNFIDTKNMRKTEVNEIVSHLVVLLNFIFDYICF